MFGWGIQTNACIDKHLNSVAKKKDWFCHCNFAECYGMKNLLVIFKLFWSFYYFVFAAEKSLERIEGLRGCNECGNFYKIFLECSIISGSNYDLN